MADKELTLKRTPLRNSSLANKPFRSPIISLTPKNKETINKEVSSSKSSPIGKKINSTPKRPLVFNENKNQIKKRRIHDDQSADKPKEIKFTETLDMKILGLKKRIRSKRQEIESLKVQLASRKKHNKNDLQEEIRIWRDGCQRALQQFQNDWNQRNPEGIYYDMRKIMSMLNIREEVVNFSNETDLL